MHMAPWPDIAGIDSADARARWCGDVALFTTMLARFFDEFGDVSVPADIGRMHKLRGGACMLGAKGVYQLAGDVEDACSRGDHDRAAQLSTRLTGEMQRLRENARPVLAGAPHHERGKLK
jgi:hypothetical protein